MATTANVIVDWRELYNSATKLGNLNDDMKATLEAIQKKITSLQGEQYESNSAVAIREKIQGMTPRFEQYYDVVNKYVVYLRSTAQEYESTDTGRARNAESFV